MSKVALLIIYNHQYNQNIEILEQIYGDRFSNIYHLIPFYTGDKSNVIPVYESSYYFQGYVAQGFKSYFKEEYEHYFFVADDLILNPAINETNYSQELKLNSNTSYITTFTSLHKRKLWWSRVGDAYHWQIKAPDVEAKDQLPDYDTALQSFKRFGLDIKPLRFDQIFTKKSFQKPYNSMSLFSYLYYQIRKFKNRNTEYHLSYPFIGSYSDIFVVSSDTIKLFSQYCGVFAATSLFVEVALPTSLILSTQEIKTQKDLDYKGKTLWTEEQYKELDIYNKSLKQLLKEFPSDCLYIHPIKLSKWNTEL